MGNVAVDVQQVSKRFRLYHEKYTSLKEKVIHAGRVPHEDLWALREVSFDVQEGETVGILGRNGSGKSTLLKCVCGVLQPTSGQVVVRGKLAGLLELGAGFQQDLSGRENIYLNGSMLGMSKREVDRVFDDIVAFAELEQFIDNQVKFYSSGMYVRLGFAVAVNVDPDVLVIDEVLAVGDERFQRKCMDRVKQFQREGRTILFVSHSPDQVRAICDRAVVLSDGGMIGHGAPGEAVRLFRERLLEAGDVLALPVNEPDPAIAEGGQAAAAGHDGGDGAGPHRPVRLAGVSVVHPGSGERPYLLTGEPMSVRIEFEASEATEGVVFVLVLRDSNGTMLLQTDTGMLGEYFDLPPGSGTVAFDFETVPFLDGAYDIVAGIQSRRGGVLYDWQEQAGKFEVMNPGKAIGIVAIPHRVTMLPVGADAR
ncbi:MAG: ABC transporter ATP-binding protein [Acidimicrobiales bacterium]